MMKFSSHQEKKKVILRIGHLKCLLGTQNGSKWFFNGIGVRGKKKKTFRTFISKSVKKY